MIVSVGLSVEEIDELVKCIDITDWEFGEDPSRDELRKKLEAFL